MTTDPLDRILAEALATPPGPSEPPPPLTLALLRETLQRAAQAPYQPTQPVVISPWLAADIKREAGLGPDDPIDAEAMGAYLVNRTIKG